jgi:hypothetical protein
MQTKKHIKSSIKNNVRELFDSKIKHNTYLIITCIVVFSALSFSSCFSVKYSTTGASISPELKTVSIQMFTNRAELAPPTIIQTLTEKLRDKCRSNTSLIIITDGGDADFAGEVTGYDTRPQVIQANNLSATERITITIKMKFTNSAEPKSSFETSFSRYRDYSNQADLETKLPEIYEELIEDIFNKAFVNW